MKQQKQSSELIRAHVVLKGPGGSLTSAAQISAQNVQSFVVDPSVREQVRIFLEKAGFSICRVSPLSITIEAPPAQFEQVFRGRLARKSAPRQIGGGKQKAAKRSKAAEGAFWTWAEMPKIPTEASDMIDAVVFPQPTKPMV